MTNRRNFISTLPLIAAACSAPGSRPEDPGIIDTHTHFYDPSRPQGVPWPPKEDSFLYRAVLPAELKRIAEPLGVTGTIVVEASPWVADNDWILQIARSEPFIKGLVGHLKPGRPNFQSDLNRLAGNPLFRGIRVGLWDIPLAPENSDFIRDLGLLADRGLSLDVLGGPDQITRISNIASALPKLRIVIDHCAGVRVTGDREKGPDPDWVRSIETIAKHPHVYMKVSGLVEGVPNASLESPAPGDVEYYRPVLDTIWNNFGEDRVIFGSNWPVSARFATYETVLAIVKNYFAAKSKSAYGKYFYRNAQKVYLAA